MNDSKRREEQYTTNSKGTGFYGGVRREEKQASKKARDAPGTIERNESICKSVQRIPDNKQNTKNDVSW